MTENEPFTKVMRRETKGIHNISDALINAKIGLAMSDDRVWSEGLLVFYEIFKYLEEALDRLKETQLNTLDIPGMRRTQAFEKDLKFYLGENWKQDYPPRDSVLKYISHLSTLEEENPILLSAYIYHLYMGLFAGGQILKKKRAIVLKLSFSSKLDSNEGLAVVNLGPEIFKIKKQMTDSMNKLAETLDDDTKTLLIEESKGVFRRNNAMVQTIQIANSVVFYKVVKLAAFVAICAFAWYCCQLSRS